MKNTNYLVGYIKESQLRYPNIFRTCYDVLKHLFLTNGNGVEFSEGEPYSCDFFGNTIFYKHSYKGGGCSLREAVERRLDYEEDEYEIKCLKNLSHCDNLPFEKMFSSENLFCLMKSSERRYYLHISRGYFKGELVNSSSSKPLLYAYLNLLKACIVYLNWEGRLEKKSVFNSKSSEGMYRQEDSSFVIYEEELERISLICKKVGLDV